MSHGTQVIPMVAAYFEADHPTPVIVAAFRPKAAVEELRITSETGLGAKAGWQRALFDKRVSRSWLRKVKDQGYTHVRLALAGREADFSIEELLR